MTCPVCGSSRTSLHKPRSLARRLRASDLRITDARYGTTLALRRCGSCGFLFAEGDELGELTDLYAALTDPEYEDSEDARMLQMRWLLERALRAAPGARSLLDVGAATGVLVAEARRRGLDAVGVEPSRALVQHARERHGVDVLHGTLPHPAIGGRRFGIVVLADVLEHVADPVSMLRAARDTLATDGLLVVVTPDVGSVAARVLRYRWWHFRLAHVGYFDRRSLATATRAAGLTWMADFRARWFLPLGYLTNRLLAFLGRHPDAVTRSRDDGPPRGVIGRALERVASRAIPIDLRDSFVVFLKRHADAA